MACEFRYLPAPWYGAKLIPFGPLNQSGFALGNPIGGCGPLSPAVHTNRSRKPETLLEFGKVNHVRGYCQARNLCEI